MDVHVPAAVTDGLIALGLDALTAQADGSGLLPDDRLLDRAESLGRVLFSQDKDMLRIAAARQRAGVKFAGVLYAHQLAIAIGPLIADLGLVLSVCEIDELRSKVTYLPLR